MRHVFLLIPVFSAALVGFALWIVMALPRPLDARVAQAVVAGALVGVGWAVTFLMQEYRRWRERRDGRLDLQLALRAEISDAFAENDEETLIAHGEEMAARILRAGDEKGEVFHVFVPKPVNLTVFNALSDRIHLLDALMVDSVIWFYSQAADVQAFAEDLRSRDYRQLPATRRAQAYGHYVDMQIEALKRKTTAISALTEAIGDEDEIAMNDARLKRRAERKAELRAWLNSRVAGRNGR
ncbi:MAG: hypothetical protein ACK5MQ_13785 [Pikeienuella sp.]